MTLQRAREKSRHALAWWGFFFAALGSTSACDDGKALISPPAPASDCATALEDPARWRPIFNGIDLSGWYSWNPTTGRDDAQRIFQVHDGVIHVLDIAEHEGEQDFAYLSTLEEFENVRIRFEFKWGTKMFNPFADHHWPKDSGFFYGVVGIDQIWPTAVEYNVFVDRVGGTVALGNAGLTTKVGREFDGALPIYSNGGASFSTPRTTDFTKTGVVSKTAGFEIAGDWNDAEIVYLGDNTLHRLNGHVVFTASSLRQRVREDSPQSDLPLTRGRLAIQEEGAEIMYRNIRVQPIDAACPL